MLAADGGRHQSHVAALLQLWPVGLFGLRVVLAVRLFVGLGAVPLRPLVPTQPSGLVLGAGPGLGTVLGILAVHRQLLRLGAVAATVWLRA